MGLDHIFFSTDSARCEAHVVLRNTKSVSPLQSENVTIWSLCLLACTDSQECILTLRYSPTFNPFSRVSAKQVSLPKSWCHFLHTLHWSHDVFNQGEGKVVGINCWILRYQKHNFFKALSTYTGPWPLNMNVPPRWENRKEKKFDIKLYRNNTNID